ncbi:MAG: carboxypeptidase-like regulatory domain-containing protein, partial [Cytophagaceae bacterium]
MQHPLLTFRPVVRPNWQWLHLFILLFTLSAASAQSVVTGTVTDATSNEVLAGATVQVKGTTIGTTTDAQGTYKINGKNLKVSTDQMKFDFEILSDTEIKEKQYGTILR